MAEVLSIESLLEKIKSAKTTDEALAAVSELNKHKKELAEAEAKKQQAEATALAGNREALEKSILPQVIALKLEKLLTDVKAKGFTFTISHKEDEKGNWDPSGAVSVKGGIALLVPTVKAKRTGSGGSHGTSKDEYGMSLSEIVEKFGTAAEKAAIAAETDNSKSWQLKNKVKKAAIAAGKLSTK